jgi:dTDP-4-dehydrorhamnose 3,5-epimerase
MNTTELETGAKLIDFPRFKDNRGWFSESWSNKWQQETGIILPFVQSNTVWTEKAFTVRGLHAQGGTGAVAKMLQVIKGEIIDVFVDARSESPTFGKWEAVHLKEGQPQLIYVPRGFYHGYATLTDDVIVHYQQDNYFDGASEHGLRFDDQTVLIDWDRWGIDINNVIVSDKDRAQKSWANATKF